MDLFSGISDIPLRLSLLFSGNKEQNKTFDEFCESQKEEPKNLVLIKAKDRQTPFSDDDDDDDVLIRLKGVPRYYPDNNDHSNPSYSDDEKEELFTIVKPDIKVVGKIETVKLDLLKQREEQIEQSNNLVKEQAKAAKKLADEQAKASKKIARERRKAAKELERKQRKEREKAERDQAKEQAKADKKLAREQAKYLSKTEPFKSVGNLYMMMSSKSVFLRNIKIN